jgi:hypothetical protein
MALGPVPRMGVIIATRMMASFHVHGSRFRSLRSPGALENTQPSASHPPSHGNNNDTVTPRKAVAVMLVLPSQRFNLRVRDSLLYTSHPQAGDLHDHIEFDCFINNSILAFCFFVTFFSDLLHSRLVH